MSDDDDVVLPKEFWQSLGEKEFDKFMDRGHLTKRQCQRLWTMLGRTDPPPKRIVPMILREDVERWMTSMVKH